MLKRSQITELPPRPGASPGLLRRRYSVPETIMRKYRLAQQRSDSEDSGATTAPSRAMSSASPSPTAGSCASLNENSNRYLRKEREVMRKSALLRRLWGKPNCNPCPACCFCNNDLYDCQIESDRVTRSLDGSRSELRPLSSSFTSSRSKESNMPAGWATPKRQRLESPAYHGSDDMLRTAMRNSYDRAEELRLEKDTRDELTDSTYRSHEHGVSYHLTTSSDSPLETSKYEADVIKIDDLSNETLSHSSNQEIYTNTENITFNNTSSDDQHPTDTDSSYSTSMPTMKEVKGLVNISNNKNINFSFEEKQNNSDINNSNNLVENKLQKLDKSSFEILEIVVSESLNTSATDQRDINHTQTAKQLVSSPKSTQNIDLDEYVSNILVESLNSLTDQLENMNATIGSDHKISVVEKEIKVKLQNTGVNTIVHLSPTSNNQIIFGNAELYNKDDDKDICNNIHEEIYATETNNNYDISTEACQETGFLQEEYCNGNYEPTIAHEAINKAVLQQIQKLFQSEPQCESPNYAETIPGISHVEISNVDVYINDNQNSDYGAATTITLQTDTNVNDNERSNKSLEVISGVGTGNYFECVDEPAIVPRFSAFPYSDSMEVNTSSSEEPEMFGSDCTSLVDSLDDPNSPRSLLLRKSFGNKRSELVRSAIDILDLLPESTNDSHMKEKGESFFIRIKDDDCDCEKENLIVADHMPENIKQRLYRRHRKREIRMECARRKKVKQIKREIEKQRQLDNYKTKKEIEKDCMSIVSALIDDVINKIAQDEYKCMKIKQKPDNRLIKMTDKKHETAPSKRGLPKKGVDRLSDMESFRISKNGKVDFYSEHKTNKSPHKKHRKSEKCQVYGKMCLKPHSGSSGDDCFPKRIYQKSEIHDGKKCIEILEILEYVESTHSSSETTNSDESQIHSSYKSKKSKIPIPTYERVSRIPKCTRRLYKSSPILNCEGSYRSNKFTEDLLESLSDDSKENSYEPSTRRVSVPHDGRSRSNSLKFRQVFDIIPEEKSSLSIESSNEDINFSRRVSAPNLSNNFVKSNGDKCMNSDCESKNIESSKTSLEFRLLKETKSIATSPLSDSSIVSKNKKSINNKSIMTSPSKKSIATSPIFTNKLGKNDNCVSTKTNKKSLSSHGTKAGWLGFYRPHKQITEEEGSKSETGLSDNKKSASTQYDLTSHLPSTVRTIESEKADPIIIGKTKDRMKSEKLHTKSKEETKRKKSEKVESFEYKEKQKSRRDNSLVRSFSDPQSRDVVIKKTDKKKIKMISVEKSEEETINTKNAKNYKHKSTNGNYSDSDTESGKSLLCSLAPKWFSVGNLRQKKQTRKKPPGQQDPENSAGGWSVTVAGNCHTALPADVEMRLSFPKNGAQVTSQSDSGFGEDCRARRTLARHHSRHCEDCTCSTGREEVDSYPPILPPANRKMTVTMKKESSGSSIHALKSTKKFTEPLPEVETFQATKNKTKSSVKTHRAYSLLCWHPGEDPLPKRTSKGLSVTGCAIVPEMKPRVPTMSERDLTRVYTPRYYLRS